MSYQGKRLRGDFSIWNDVLARIFLVVVFFILYGLFIPVNPFSNGLQLVIVFLSVVVFIPYPLYKKVYKFFISVGIVKSDNRNKKNSFIIPTTSKKLNLDMCQRGVFVCGAAGSGKTESILEPLVKQSAVKGLSGITYDLKFPKMYNVFKSNMSNNIRLLAIDFTNLKQSNSINIIPKSLAVDYFYCDEIAQALVKTEKELPNFWESNARLLIANSIYFLARNRDEEDCNFTTFIDFILRDKNKIMEDFSLDSEIVTRISPLRSSMTNEKAFADIFSTAQTPLSLYADENIKRILSGTNQNLSFNETDNLSHLVIGSDAKKMNAFAPLVSMIFTACLRQMNAPNRENAVAIIDEAPTVNIPNIEQIPATARENKLGIVYSCQTIAQMNQQIGQERTNSVIDNLSSQFYGYSTNVQTAEKITKLFGKVDEYYITDNKGKSRNINNNIMDSFLTGGPPTSTKSSGRSEALRQIDKYQSSELSSLKIGEFFVVTPYFKGKVKVKLGKR